MLCCNLLLSQVADRFDDGTKALDRAEQIISTLIGPFENFVTAVGRLSSSFDSALTFLNGVVEFATRTLFCAFQKQLDLGLEYYDRVRTWIDQLLENVGKATNLINNLRENLSILNRFKE